MSQITNHMLNYASRAPSPNYSGVINPKFIVMHYTAGWNAESAIRTFSNPNSNVSAHLTVDLDGKVYQHVPFNIKAWHAGPSRYMGYNGLNSHSVGIEIVNIGFLRKVGENQYQDSYGSIKNGNQLGPLVEAPNPRVGGGVFYWPVYPERQLASVEAITAELIATYPILDIVTHEEIDTRGWKTDPGPAFPMHRYKRLLPNRNQNSDSFIVTASSLNVRSGPGPEFPATTAIPRGTVVEAVGKSGVWVRISQDGWVHGSYLQRV